MNWEKLRNDIRLFIVLAFILLVYFIIGRILPTGGCLIRFIFGIPCPGCGITRALLYLVLLNPTKAWSYNPGIFFLFPYVLILLYFRYFKRDDHRLFFERTAYVIAAILLFIYVIRMLTVFPNETPMIFYSESLLGRLFAA